MQTNIHPQYGPAELQCACGNTFSTRSTKKILKIEICNQCHPFFTGKHKFVDKAGRIERFMRKYNKPSSEAKNDEEASVSTENLNHNTSSDKT